VHETDQQSWKGWLWTSAGWNRQGMMDLSVFGRDRQMKKAVFIDTNLWSLMAWIQTKAGANQPIVVTSVYRDPQRPGESDVARNRHAQGRAIDFRAPNLDYDALRNYARSLGVGGVGAYANKSHIHMDTGPYRSWNS
jgi:uncharacterized protein YcbK (DUF882 family)